MDKKIIVLSSSPRRHGNSDTLADQFIQGCKDANNLVEKIYLPDQKINYCKGCMACTNTNKCIQKDDMEVILNKMVNADVIVFATPVYFYTMNAQMKTLIDRCAPRYTELSSKDYYIIMSAAETDKQIMNHVLDGFQGFFDCLDDARLKGVIYGLGLNHPNDVQTHTAKEEAYQMAKKIG